MCVFYIYICTYVNESAAVLLFNMMMMMIKIIVQENSLVILTFPFPKMYKYISKEKSGLGLLRGHEITLNARGFTLSPLFI